MNKNNIFVGNLAFAAKTEDVEKLFGEFGRVASVTITTKKGGKSRGFGFLEMADDAGVKAAIAGLNGKEFMGRPLNVSAVVPKGVLAHPEKFPAKKRWEPRDNSDFNKTSDPRPYRKDNERAKFPGKPWEKSSGGAKPYRKFSGNPKAKPWEKPWDKKESGNRPYRKEDRTATKWTTGKSEEKPWEKREYRKSSSGAKPWSKSGGEAKPYRKFSGPAKPWEKKEGGPKPFFKAVAQSSKLTRTNKSSFKPRPKDT